MIAKTDNHNQKHELFVEGLKKMLPVAKFMLNAQEHCRSYGGKCTAFCCPHYSDVLAYKRRFRGEDGKGCTLKDTFWVNGNPPADYGITEGMVEKMEASAYGER